MKVIYIYFQGQQYHLDSEFARQVSITDGYVVPSETKLVEIITTECHYRLTGQLPHAKYPLTDHEPFLN